MAVALPFVGADQVVEAVKLSALAAWRMTKGIFRVDQTLMAALIETPIDAAVPVDVLLRLPGWCIYLELDQLPTFRSAARGVWVSLEPADPREVGRSTCSCFSTPSAIWRLRSTIDRCCSWLSS